jgi:ABC-type lipoprotein export system ATPase subunit
MKIKAISVTRLFGIFNHVIRLNTEERVTIIHGCNGFGKTVLLNMIDGLFNRRYSVLRNIPFAEFRVEFENNSYVEVTKNPPQGSREQSLTCRFRGPEAEQEFSVPLLPQPISDLTERELKSIDELVPELNRVNYKQWFSTTTEELYSLEEVLEQFGPFLPFLATTEEEPQKSFKELITAIKVHLVGIERLQQLPTKNANQSLEIIVPRKGGRGIIIRQAVPRYAKELAQEIKSRLTEFAALSQKLDQSFPTRLFKESSHSALTGEDLQQKLEQLEKRRSALKDVGLLDQEAEETAKLSSLQEDEELAKRVLPIYIQDVEQKLNVFDQDRLADKLQKFKDIINRDFYYKQMTLDKERGVIFTASTGELLSPNHLSTGEQHLFVLFYELLFKTVPHSLLLIDEPEQSLHLEWQIEFLENVQEILQLVNCEVLIATHSPDIIHNKWDLTVGLKDVSV